MPELPEVETIRRALAPALVGRCITRVRILRRDVVTRFGDDALSPRRRTRGRPLSSRALLSGATVAGVERKGKQLAIIAQDERAIVIALGMTGQLLLPPPPPREAGAPPPPTGHVHLVWRLDDGSRLLFRDVRRFGGVLAGLSAQDLRERVWGRLGPDALTISAAQLRRAIGESERAIKAALLDQERIAGVGNIYADEACFLAGIHPARPCRDLAADEIKRLARAVRTVLRRAIAARGSTLRDYVTPSGAPGQARFGHQVYGRAGLACRGCGGTLERGVVGQRTTVFCAACQK